MGTARVSLWDQVSHITCRGKLRRLPHLNSLARDLRFRHREAYWDKVWWGLALNRVKKSPVIWFVSGFPFQIKAIFFRERARGVTRSWLHGVAARHLTCSCFVVNQLAPILQGISISVFTKKLTGAMRTLTFCNLGQMWLFTWLATRIYGVPSVVPIGSYQFKGSIHKWRCFLYWELIV